MFGFVLRRHESLLMVEKARMIVDAGLKILSA